VNLDLGILWIEDTFSQEEEQELKRRVQDAGFIARIETIPNGNGIDDLAKDHQLYHNYDIILLDYRLHDESGDALAPRVRSLFPSTTILFYSGSVDENGLRKLIAKKEVDGVYCSARTRFIERAGALVEQTARSLERLSGMRGLAMKVVAECDDLMKESVLSMSARNSMCLHTVSDLDSDVLAFIKEVETKYTASTNVDLAARLKTRAVDSAKLFKHFRRLTKIVTSNGTGFGLDSDRIDRLRELRKISKQYVVNVLDKRNTLGHAKEEKEAAGYVLKGSNEIRVSDFGDLRRTFADHSNAFREMQQLVTILDGQEP
jgi:CheY-like chemotaxis protein